MKNKIWGKQTLEDYGVDMSEEIVDSLVENLSDSIDKEIFLTLTFESIKEDLIPYIRDREISKVLGERILTNEEIVESCLENYKYHESVDRIKKMLLDYLNETLN